MELNNDITLEQGEISREDLRAICAEHKLPTFNLQLRTEQGPQKSSSQDELPSQDYMLPEFVETLETAIDSRRRDHGIWQIFDGHFYRFDAAVAEVAV